MSGAEEILREVERLRASTEQLCAVTERNRAMQEQVFKTFEARSVARRQRRAELIAVLQEFRRVLDALPDRIASELAAARRERSGRGDHAG